MSNEKTLYKTKWLSLKSMTVDAAGGAEYIYVHSEASGGLAVAVLPFRNLPEGSLEFLLRREVVPPWGLYPTPCSLTGMHEGDCSFAETAQRELKEEAGYTADLDRIISLGKCHPSKASDTVVHMFLADLSGLEQGKAEGDGSAFEELGSCYWTQDPFESEDALMLAMVARLLKLED